VITDNRFVETKRILYCTVESDIIYITIATRYSDIYNVTFGLFVPGKQ